MTTDLNVPHEGIIKSEDFWQNWKLGVHLFWHCGRQGKSHWKLDTHHGLLAGKQTLCPLGNPPLSGCSAYR